MAYRSMRFPGGRLKAVTLSYDDGCRDDIKFVDIINHYGLKCTFNINSSLIGKSETSWRLTKNEIYKFIISSGHEIANHGAEHLALGKLNSEDGINEVLTCKQTLEKEFGIPVKGFAYAGSGITIINDQTTYQTIKAYLSDLGIVYARTLGGDNKKFEIPQDWYAWMPTVKHTNPEIKEYINAFLKEELNIGQNELQSPKLFYLWGHSFEFERNNDWSLLQEICELLAGHSDVWYATNMEIYEYVEAYRNLIFTADGMCVFNPSHVPVWFVSNQRLYCVKSRETLRVF